MSTMILMTAQSSATYVDAAQRTQRFFNNPARIGTKLISYAVLVILLALLSGKLIGGVWWAVPCGIIAILLILLTVNSVHMDRTTRNHRPPLFSEPVRASFHSIDLGAASGPVLMTLGAFIAGDLAATTSNWLIRWMIIITIAVIVTGAAALPRSFGFSPLARELPADFEQRCPYPATSPEARINAALTVATLRRGYAMFTDQLPYFAILDDGELNPALHTLEAAKIIRIEKNYSALTEKGRARSFVQLTDTAPGADSSRDTAPTN